MAQIILVDNDKQLTTALKAKLIKLHDSEVIIKETAGEALSMLQILGEVKLIIAKDQIGKEQTALKIYEQISADQDSYPQDVPILIIGHNMTGNTQIKTVDKTASLDYMAGMSLFLMGKGPAPKKLESATKVGVIKTTATSERATVVDTPLAAPPIAVPLIIEEKAPDYVGVSIYVFLYLVGQNNLFETYTRTRKKDKGHEYSTKIPKDVLVEEEGVRRLITRGVEELYVLKESFLQNQELLNDILLAKLNDSSITGIDRMELFSTLYKLSLDLFKFEIHTKETAKLLKANSEALKIMITGSGNIFMLFENGRRIKELSYGFCHLFLTNTLLYKCLMGMDWFNEELQGKLFSVIYFHDLALHNERMIKAHHHYFSEHKAFNSEEATQFINHALNGAEILMKLGLVTTDMVSMLKEHHGIKSGKGFAETLSIIISPLSMCILTIEEFVTRYMDLGLEFTPEDLQGIFTEMEKKYNKLTYELTLKKLRSIYK